MENKMRFFIGIDNSLMKYRTKEEFLAEISAQIDDCIANGGTEYSIEVEANASCFAIDAK